MNGRKMRHTSMLFAMPSITSGAARVMDLGGLFDSYKTNQSDEAADRAALASDWQAVGSDLKKAMSSIDKECRTSTAK
jgi:hypothetical protein